MTVFCSRGNCTSTPGHHFHHLEGKAGEHLLPYMFPSSRSQLNFQMKICPLVSLRAPIWAAHTDARNPIRRHLAPNSNVAGWPAAPD